MPYWQLFYHLVWATKDCEPRLTPDFAKVIYGYLRSKAIELGASVFALNGIEDHVHMVAAIPPKIAVARFVGQVKGVASSRFNRSGLSDSPFSWQDDYGVCSFDGKHLPNYITYVERQKEYHAQHATIPILERVEHGAVKMLHESPGGSELEFDAWWRDLDDIAMG